MTQRNEQLNGEPKKPEKTIMLPNIAWHQDLVVLKTGLTI